jgi:hypothetical protein
MKISDKDLQKLLFGLYLYKKALNEFVMKK